MRTGACDWWGVWPVLDVSGPTPIEWMCRRVGWIAVGLHRLTLILRSNFHPTTMTANAPLISRLCSSPFFFCSPLPRRSALCYARPGPTVASSYINPSNLSNAFPWMDTVTDVTSFDIAALNYFTDPYEWQATKFERELGCTNASTAVIRWERTVLCSQWVNERWSVQCGQYYSECQWRGLTGRRG